ncbi:tRNA nucleotidyltransferase (CCA-adding enzyme) [Paenibacillus rhizosphaerae]|uniref:tRNA nucleotidyltransferase (CCA-adding enzyme) n=1 Tax=Paenibacillus rhizosphaerae TaxID=297318 RepID=A0A839TLL9_9BACL|nr:CCA tRNA nucleotidyltransferase [Paenibacillus rhizosphaerae]MBB3127696.1 tRNA nucleotidyltransferase (CCA-adding enzyme) [Paenibacillus rhizosphaerae]
MKWKQADAGMAGCAEQVLSVLETHGHEAYWVGGCVRDELMGRPVNDMDITTSARPDEVTRLFERTVPTGIEHGTVTVLVENHAFEVTTYRVEGSYENHRRPSEVAFVRNLSEDLRRRDFTMNAIACDRQGRIVDPYHGEQDIREGVIRCVGEARVRFQEDALRMVRCIRFASVFGYRIAFNTWKGLLLERDGIQYIALERIRAELDKMMEGPHPYLGLCLLGRSRLLEKARVPFTCAPTDGFLSRIGEIPSSEAAVRWALLMIACGLSGQDAGNVMRQYTFSNEARERVEALLYLDTDVKGLSRETPLREQWVGLVLKYGGESVRRWLLLCSVLPQEHRGTAADELLAHGREWMDAMKIFRLHELQIGGSDLIAISGKRGGPWVGELLKRLLFKVAAGMLPNTKLDLTEEVRRVMVTDEKG